MVTGGKGSPCNIPGISYFNSFDKYYDYLINFHQSGEKMDLEKKWLEDLDEKPQGLGASGFLAKTYSYIVWIPGHRVSSFN